MNDVREFVLIVAPINHPNLVSLVVFAKVERDMLWLILDKATFMPTSP